MTHMTSDQAFAAIEKIAATSKTAEKLTLVKQFLAFDTFKRVVTSALNPLTTYGMQQVPDAIPGAAAGSNTFENAPVWDCLDKMAKRELTGNAARDEVQRLMTFLTPGSAELFKRILRGDLRAGFSSSTVNKAWKGLLPEFPYMRCVLPAKAKFDMWNWQEGAFSQEKADGEFINLDVEVGGIVRMTTRQGNPLDIDKFQEIVDSARESITAGTQTHGEVVVFVDSAPADRKTSNGIMNRVLAGGDFLPNEKPVYFAWDQIPLASVAPKGKHNVTYRSRFKALLLQIAPRKGQGALRVIPTRIVHSLQAAYEHCRELQLQGKEGTVLKNGDGIWYDTDSGNKDVVKLKLEVDVDLVTVGIVLGRDGTKNEGRAGSITMETSDGLLRVDVAVKNEKLRDAIDADPNSFLQKIWKVTFNDIMRPGKSNELHSLFLPRMAVDHYRQDKDVADTLERVFEQFEAAIRGEAVLEEATA